MLSIPSDLLQQFTADVFAASGCSRAEAERVARHLVAANLAGHDSHGVARIPRYVQMQREGMLLADQQPEVVVDTPVLAVVDGKFGFGQTVAPLAVQLGIDKCKAMGLSAIGLRNAGHIGRVADWAEMAAEHGLVSVHFVNATGSPLVAPFGTSERRFSTAPYCVGVPVNGRQPLLLDFATSVVAEGKVMVASQGGRPIPADALIGPDGKVSDDAHLLYGDYESTGKRDVRNGQGAIRAFGEHKGSGSPSYASCSAVRCLATVASRRAVASPTACFPSMSILPASTQARCSRPKSCAMSISSSTAALPRRAARPCCRARRNPAPARSV